MRSEKEMYDLIIGTAGEDDRIRAVYMNGSRTNKNAPQDIFQDYDIVYVVRETKPFYENRGWIDRFGKRFYMQCPEAMDAMRGEAADFDSCYGWLIQLADGNRLDLHVETAKACHADQDRLCRVLLDKDGILKNIPDAEDVDYRVKKPAECEYLAVCNEFWWCMNNVAKGLWREEVTYAHEMLDFYVRTELKKVLEWYVGILTDFEVSCGKSGKYMYRWLPKELWERYLNTWSGSGTEEMWRAVLVMCDLFDEAAGYVGENLGFTYNVTEADNSRKHLLHVRELPKDAKAVY